jgi:hypothetical protein
MSHRIRRIRRRPGSSGGFAVSAACAGVVLAVIVGHAGHPGVTGPVRAAGAGMAAARAGGTLDCSQLEALWESAGGSAGAAFMAAEIAEAESSGRQYATDDDGDGSTDRGYWQVNSVHGSLSTYAAYGNARAAVLISGDGTNWNPWTTYRTGAYAGRC